MTFFYRFLLSCVCYSLASMLLFAQSENRDSLWTLRKKEEAIKTYYQSIKENAPFFNGAEYTGHGQNIIGHPFFANGNAYSGFLEYDGVLYNNVSMQYDIVDDAIIISDFTNNYFIRLNSKKIGRFTLYDYVFIQPSFYQGAGEVPENGFFQQLYNGSTTILVKRKKMVIHKTTMEEKSNDRYRQFNSYYIRKGNVYLAIGRNKDVIRAYADKKNEIRKFIGENKLNFRKKPDEMLERTAAYYDQLKK